MKKSFLFITLLVVAITASAAVVEPERALQIAKDFVPKQAVSAQGHKAPAAEPAGEIVYTHYMPKSGKPAIYVINIGEAFALVSADDVAHPILGYNYSKSWPTDGNIPPQVKSFFDDLAQQMEAASEHPQDDETAAEWRNPRKSPNRAKANDNLPDSVGPLLTTTWDQGQYYNALCPEDDQSPYDGHVPTGCVATAMAQIINYWGQKEPIKTRGKHSYRDNYGTLEVDYDNTTYDFAHMPDALTSESTPEEVNAVAKLIYECGVAVNMIYDINESGAFNQEARAAFINFFHISADASYTEKVYFSEAEWSNMLKQEIVAGRPIYYAGNSELGGHAFICNGYQQDGYFYFNYGWSGLADGWYLTNSTIGYTSNQSAILGIIPDNTGNIILGRMNGTSTFVVDKQLEFYHLMGHNTYQVSNHNNTCNSTTQFISPDDSNQLVLETLEFEDQTIQVYDGIGLSNFMQWLSSSYSNVNTAIISTQNSFSLHCTGWLKDKGFLLLIGTDDSSCRAVTNINAYCIDDEIIHISWDENGHSTQYEIEYGINGFPIGKGIKIMSNDTQIDIAGLKKMEWYDFYIRPLCQSRGKKIKAIAATYWQDIVKQQPEGYSDNGGYITVSTAEGLAWWAVAKPYNYNLEIIADINLEGRLWRPVEVGGDPDSYQNINGNGHRIENMNIYEPYYDEFLSNSVGFISTFYGDTIKDIIINNPNIISNSYITGVLVGKMLGKRIMNCGIENGKIRTNSLISGGLIGTIDGYNAKMQVMPEIFNCFAKCEINSYNELCYGSVGGLVGNIRKSTIKNSYSASLVSNITGWTGGIGGYYDQAAIVNCYRNMTRLEYVDGASDTTNYRMFYDDAAILDKPVILDDVVCNDLLTALNKGVEIENNGWKTWVADTLNINGGYPIFVEKQIVTCKNVNNIKADNIIEDKENLLRLSWEPQEDISLWEIKIYEKDSLETSAIFIDVDSNIVVIHDLIVGTTYKIFVKPLCDNTTGSWGNGIEFLYDLPYWTEVVTTQPEGYVEDANGNVSISSAEGLAWLASCVNGLNGQTPNAYSGKTITIQSDIDLSGYKWMPIGLSMDIPFSGNVNGLNKIINNLYVNENSNCAGLFGWVYLGKFSNCILQEANVYGRDQVGALCGFYASGYGWFNEFLYDDVIIDNCHSLNSTIKGIYRVGGLLGCSQDFAGIKVRNCSTTGNVYSWQSGGGIIGDWSTSNESNKFDREGHIRNCYSSANIYIDNDYAGGIVAYADGNIQNCYSIGSINIDKQIIQYTGQIIGVLHTGLARYLYCLNDCISPYIGSLYLSSVARDLDTFSSDLFLTNGVIIKDTRYTNLLSALNAWVDANNSEGLYRHWVADTQYINSGFPIFDPNDNPTGIDNISQQATSNSQKFLRDGQVLIRRGDKVYTIMGQEVK